MSSERYYRTLERRVGILESMIIEAKRDQEILNNFLGNDYYNKYNLIKNKIKDADYKDIYKLVKKDLDDVKNYIDNFQSNRDIRRSDKQGATKLYEDDEWVVYKITTYDASKYYGRGTKWCISGNYSGHEERGEEYFYDYIDRYNLDGGYYFYINKKNHGDKYCLLQGVNGRVYSIWDASDKDLGSKNTVGLPVVPGINLEVVDADAILLDGVGCGDATLVKNAISIGADVNVTDEYSYTALMYAASEGLIKIAKLLIDAGADVNAKNKYGSTALMQAILYGYHEIVKLLLDANADVNAKNKYGSTALKIALEHDYDDIAELLVNHGAKSESRKRNRLNRKYLF